MKNILLASLTAFWTVALLAQENSWPEQVQPAIEKARQSSDLEDARTAFDVAYRADDWEAGLAFADWVADKPRLRKPLVGYLSRARFRAGQMFEAEDLIERIRLRDADEVTLEMLIRTHLSRGEYRQAARAGRTLEQRDQRTTGGLLALLAIADQRQDLKKAEALVKELLASANPDDGYPDIFVAEGLSGVDEFLSKVGDEPMNHIQRPGKADLVDLPLVSMLACRVKIDGHGPYNMILDTGGSVVISLERTIAEEIGIESLGEAAVRGVSGKGTSSQVLFKDVRIGSIRMDRVMGRVFDVHKAAAFSADGIIGTGIFGSGRMKIDLVDGELEVTRSKTGDAPGDMLATRIIADGKILTDARVNGLQRMAFWDSGASISLLSPTLLGQLNPDKPVEPLPGMDTGMGIMGVGGDAGPVLYQGPLVELRFGKKTFDRAAGLGIDILDTVISPIIGVQTDILVGLPTVREMKSMTVDYRRRRMWVDWLD